MADKAALEARILYSVPVDPIHRLRFYALRSLVGSGLMFVVTSGLLALLGSPSPWWWFVGWFCLLLSIAAALTYVVWAPHVTRARTFYEVNVLVRLPLFALQLLGGARIVEFLLGPGAGWWIYGGFLSGLLFVPSAIARKRAWIRSSMRYGHLRKSLDEDEAEWDTRFDLDHILKDPRAMRPGFLWRLLFWIGPAIGMSLADVLGRLSAALVVGLAFMATGYGVLITLVTSALAHSLELRDIEKRISRQISLDRG